MTVEEPSKKLRAWEPSSTEVVGGALTSSCLKVSSPSVGKEQGGPLRKCVSYEGRVQPQGMCCGAQNALNRVSKTLKMRFRN